MSGVPLSATTPEQVESFWVAVAVANPGGFANRPGERTLLEEKKRVEAYLNHSRWVADCPACGGGISCWSENPRGCCLDCGRVYAVRFPSVKRRQEAEKLLLEFPEPWRNWHPASESLPELRQQAKVARARLKAGR